jgi:hypothetical protein
MKAPALDAETEAEEESAPGRNYVRTTTDAFRLVHSETLEQINQRAPN